MQFISEHVDELEERLQVLIARNEDLAALLKKANINVPPCKVGPLMKEATVEKQADSSPEVASKKTVSKKKSVGTETKLEESPSVSKSVIESNITTSEVVSSSCLKVSTCQAEVPISSDVTTGSSAVVTTSLGAANIPSTCLVMANNQIVGTLQQANTGRNVNQRRIHGLIIYSYFSECYVCPTTNSHNDHRSADIEQRKSVAHADGTTGVLPVDR